MILPLFALGEIKLIIFVVVMILYVVNHLIGAAKKTPPKTDPRPPNGPRPLAQSRQQVDAELNDFLRRAAEKRAEAVQQSPPASAGNREPSQKRKKKPAPSIIIAQTVEEPLSKRRMVSALEVRDEARSREPRVGQLSQTVNEIDSHVQQAFDRPLGQFGQAGTPVSATPAAPPVDVHDQPVLAPSVASDLTAMLTDPRSLRDAIILNEILSRPEHRW